MTKRPKVTVLGSLNMDISVTVPRLPGPGATVLGSAARFTPGAALASAVGPDGAEVIEGFRVLAVDTVGAGDTFVGALAVALAAGVPAPDAIKAAAAAGAAAVTRPGAQTAMPGPAEILATTGVIWPVA